MTCDEIRGKLTGYLDGELADARGSAVRGHLRECAACRQASEDEAMLRDGLRDLAPVDPPASLWAGVQARLAEAEVADAHQPGWKRVLGRITAPAWLSWPQFAVGGLVAAGVVAVIVLRSPGDERVTAVPTVATLPVPVVPVEPVAAADVTADLAGDTDRATATYADAAEELLVLATEARASWSADQQTQFDTRVAELRGAIASTSDGRPRQAAWRSLIRYLQRAAVRNDIAFAGGMP